MKKGIIVVVSSTVECVWIGTLQLFLSTKGLYDQQVDGPFTFSSYNVKDVDRAIELFTQADLYSKCEAGPWFEPKDAYESTMELFNKLIIRNAPRALTKAKMDYSQWNKKVITSLVTANKYSKKGVYFRNKKGTNVFRFIAANNLEGDFKKIEIIFYQYKKEKLYFKMPILVFIKNYRFCNWYIARKIMQMYNK